MSFSIYVSASNLSGIEVGTTPTGRPFLSLNTGGHDSVTLVDNTGQLAAMLRLAADDLDARATPELWVTA